MYACDCVCACVRARTHVVLLIVQVSFAFLKVTTSFSLPRKHGKKSGNPPLHSIV